MATLFDSPFLRARLQQAAPGDSYPGNDGRFGRCDCTSYSYFILSLVLFAVGTVITVLALGDADGRLFSHLGHMWLVGPIFICSGMMVAVKGMLYLRRKSVIQMLLHQRAIFRNLAAAQAEQSFAIGQFARTASTATLPPSYDTLIGGTSTAQTSNTEIPPPSYDEAMFLIGDEIFHSIIQMKHSTQSVSKESDIANVCQNFDNTKP